MAQTHQTTNRPNRPRCVISLPIAFGLLLLSALPDAMVVPVLRQLIVDRYGVAEGDAHKFMYVNLLGAMVAVIILARVRSKCSLRVTIGLSAALNGAMLAIMSLPIGFASTLLVRFVEGGFDLVVYAMLFDVIGQTGSAQTRGRRMGAAATFMLIGLAGGIGLGGRVGHNDASAVLIAGALACVAVSCISLLSIDRFAYARVSRSQAIGNPSSSQVHRPLWPALGMMFSDRALAGLLATTVSLFLSSAVLGLTQVQIGGLIGLAMLMIAIGAWPAGRLIDAFGCLRIRVVAGIVYAAGLATLPFIAHGNMVVLACVFAMIGLGGAALFASSLVVVCRSHMGPAGMAAYHTAGNFGFMIGPMLAGAILGDSSRGSDSFPVYAGVLLGFAGFHFIMNMIMTLGANSIVRTHESTMPSSHIVGAGSSAGSTLRK